MKSINQKQLCERLGLPEAAICQLRARDPEALPTPFSASPLLWREETVDSWIGQKRKSPSTKKRGLRLAAIAFAAAALAAAAILLWSGRAQADWGAEWFDKPTSVSSGGYPLSRLSHPKVLRLEHYAAEGVPSIRPDFRMRKSPGLRRRVAP